MAQRGSDPCGPAGCIDSLGSMSDSDDLRTRAIDRLEGKQQFWGIVAVWVGVSALTVIVWVLSGAGYFWPMWPMFGIGIGVVAAGWRVFGPTAGGISEAKIQSEIERLNRS